MRHPIQSFIKGIYRALIPHSLRTNSEETEHHGQHRHSWDVAFPGQAGGEERIGPACPAISENQWA